MRLCRLHGAVTVAPRFAGTAGCRPAPVIVVERSVWIGQLRGQASPAVLRLHAIVRDADDQDMIIGTFCLARGHALLHDDLDFDPMAAHPGLRIVPV